jgi:DNA repair exonuclease SbcCD ATPase subunit
MGLTNERAEAQKKIETYQALLDIAVFVKELAARPDFTELSKLAFSLPEADRKKADEGRALIAEIDRRSAQLKTMNEQNNALLLSIEKKVRESAEIDKKIAELAEREVVVANKEKFCSTKESELNTQEARLKADKDALANERSTFEQAKKDDKERVEAMRKLAEGL